MFTSKFYQLTSAYIQNLTVHNKHRVCTGTEHMQAGKDVFFDKCTLCRTADEEHLATGCVVHTALFKKKVSFLSVISRFLLLLLLYRGFALCKYF